MFLWTGNKLEMITPLIEWIPLFFQPLETKSCMQLESTIFQVRNAPCAVLYIIYLNLKNEGETSKLTCCSLQIQQPAAAKLCTKCNT